MKSLAEYVRENEEARARALASDPLRPSKHDLADIGKAMLGDHWSAQFWKLYAKSDREHRTRLALAFPAHAIAFDEWYLGTEGGIPDA